MDPPAGFEVRQLALGPGGARPYDEEEWLDALVIVEEGEIELECADGGCSRFGRGAVLWLVGLPLRALHNRGRGNTVLIAVSRKR